jgi:3-oxoacyl-[acyl-carrier-protein] synthase II
MRRVVVTGLGAVTPLGNNVDEFWDNCINGISGASKITRFNAEKFRTQIACEVKDFDPKKYLDRNEIKRSDLFTQYALYASSQAIEDAGLDLKTINPFDIGVIWGSGQGGMQTFEDEVKAYALGDGTPRFSPFFVPRLIANMASGLISMKYGLQGINYTTVSACATSNTAIMDAYNYIKIGKANIMVTGGSEAPITEASLGGFCAMKAMSTRNHEPKKASRPFDKDRDGFVMGEGSGALILESLSHAKRRGAKVYAEVVGAAMTADAYHMTAPHPEGIGATQAMKLALKEAKLIPERVDYINMHATSTPVGDSSELIAVNNVFGNNNKRLSLGSTKSMTGHLLGAAGAIEGIVAIKSIQDNVIPPTINITNIQEDLPLKENLVMNKMLKKEVNIVMSNAFGFGGHNSSVVFKNYR